MLEKIDKFIDKFLKWKVLKNIILAQILLVIHALIATAYNISGIPFLIMNISYGLAIILLAKAIREFMKREESL